MSKIAENIRFYRMKQNWTQKMLAEKLSISDSSISNYEKSINEPSIQMVMKLAELFQVSTDELYGVQTKKSTKPSALQTLKQVKKIRFRHVNETFIPVPFLIILFAALASLSVFYFSYSIIDTAFIISWVLLFIFSASSIVNGKNSTYHEITMDVNDSAYYRKMNPSNTQSTLTFVLINIKFIFSVLATLFAYTVLNIVLEQTLSVFLGLAIVVLIVLYVAIFITTFTYLISFKQLPFQKVPDHFHTWLFRAMYGYDAFIVFVSAFMFISNITVFSFAAADITLMPIIFIANLLLSHHVCNHVLKAFLDFKVITVKA